MQNLETGQAICRVEKADGDFNLSIPFPECVDPAAFDATRQTVISASRRKYATPRAEVEAALLAKLINEDAGPEPVKPKPASPPLPNVAEKKAAEVPKVTVSEKEIVSQVVEKAAEPPATVTREPEPPRELGRGGAQHKAIQERLQAEARALGFFAELESPIGGPSKRAADLGLKRGKLTIAVEISITTTTDHEFGNVKKCLDAGFSRVAVVSPEPERLEQIRAAVLAGLGSEPAEKVSYHTPDGFIAEMRKFPPEETAKPAAATEPSERTTRGFKVRRHGVGMTTEERQAKEKAAVQMLAKAMKRKA